MDKKVLNAQATKKKFIESIHRWLTNTLETNGHPEYKENFTIEDSSIMCQLPDCFFTNFDIPKNTKIEMKFVVKKS